MMDRRGFVKAVGAFMSLLLLPFEALGNIFGGKELTSNVLFMAQHYEIANIKNGWDVVYVVRKVTPEQSEAYYKHVMEYGLPFEGYPEVWNDYTWEDFNKSGLGVALTSLPFSMLSPHTCPNEPCSIGNDVDKIRKINKHWVGVVKYNYYHPMASRTRRQGGC